MELLYLPVGDGSIYYFCYYCFASLPVSYVAGLDSGYTVNLMCVSFFIFCTDNISDHLILGCKSGRTTPKTWTCDQGCTRLPKSPRAASWHKKQCKFSSGTCIFQISPFFYLWLSCCFSGSCFPLWLCQITMPITENFHLTTLPYHYTQKVLK